MSHRHRGLVSKALTSFFCMCSRDSLGFKPSRGEHRQVTFVVDGGFVHRRQHLTCNVRVDSAHYLPCEGEMSTSLRARKAE